MREVYFIMKILTNKRYNAMLDLIAAQQKTIRIYQKQVKKLEHDIRLLKNINSPDIIFPNTDERGLGDSETPNNISEIYEL